MPRFTVVFLVMTSLLFACNDATQVLDASDSGRDASVADGGYSPDACCDSGVSPDGTGPWDGSADGGTDGQFDSSIEDASQIDAGTDAGVDSGIDSGLQDTGTDGGSAGADTGTDGGVDGGKAWVGLFDMDWIRDQSAAKCSFTDHSTTMKDGVLVDVWRLSYKSWEVIDGNLHEILIRGFASMPFGKTGVPGVVQAHGLGGYSEQDHATGLASKIGAFVIAYTGPGGGTVPENTSEGLPAGYNSGYKMFDTLKDVRGSWFWGHAAAAMRALTCIETRPEVEKTKLGITGFSAGGVISFITSGADDRIKAAVPLSGVLAWNISTQSPDAWQNALLAQAGLSTSSPEWTILMDQLIKPSVLMPSVKGKIMLVNGSTDEFFPLTAHNATLDAVPGDDKRNSIAANFDHGCYSYTGLEDKDKIETRAETWAVGGQKMWFGHWFGTDDDFTHVPLTPIVQAQSVGGGILVAAVVDGGGSKLDVEEVKAWGSNDNCLFFASATLDKGSGYYSKLLPVPLQSNTVIFVDVTYKTKALVFPKRFSISSRPSIPDGLIPDIRSISSCM